MAVKRPDSPEDICRGLPDVPDGKEHRGASTALCLGPSRSDCAKEV